MKKKKNHAYRDKVASGAEWSIITSGWRQGRYKGKALPLDPHLASSTPLPHAILTCDHEEMI